MKSRFSVHAYIDPGNYDLMWLIGQVRRLADELGRPGILAKRGQTNERILKKGYVRTKWPSRRLARKYQDMVDEFWGNNVMTHRFRIRSS